MRPGCPASVGRRDALLPVSSLAWALLGAGCAVATLIRSNVALLKQRWADLTANRSEVRFRLYHVKYKRADYS